MTSTGSVPETILELVVEHTDELLPTSVFCAGFEDGAWRSEDLSYDLIAWAADWILPPEELSGYNHANGVALLGKALSRVYKTIDYVMLRALDQALELEAGGNDGASARMAARVSTMRCGAALSLLGRCLGGEDCLERLELRGRVVAALAAEPRVDHVADVWHLTTCH